GRKLDCLPSSLTSHPNIEFGIIDEETLLGTDRKGVGKHREGGNVAFSESEVKREELLRPSLQPRVDLEDGFNPFASVVGQQNYSITHRKFGCEFSASDDGLAEVLPNSDFEVILRHRGGLPDDRVEVDFLGDFAAAILLQMVSVEECECPTRCKPQRRGQ